MLNVAMSEQTEIVATFVVNRLTDALRNVQHYTIREGYIRIRSQVELVQIYNVTVLSSFMVISMGTP